MKRTVALLGGAFDPITKGHIQVAQFVKKRLKHLDEVWIMPVVILLIKLWFLQSIELICVN